MEIFESFKKEDILSYADSAQFCSVGFGGQFEWLILPKTTKDFCSYISALIKNGAKFKVLGNMTNIIPADGVMKGIYVCTKLIDEQPKVLNNRIICSCGTNLSAICLLAKDNNLSGMENLFGIPGSVGGAIFNNAGAFGTEISDVLESALVLDGNEMKSLSAKDFEFGYRKSNLQNNKQIVLSATFMLHSGSKDDIIATMRECAQKRSQTQPQAKSAGSVFKKNQVASAGLLIDKCGLKGTACGGAQISSKHANFIINTGGSTSKDYKSLVELAKSKVYQKFGVVLEREVEYLGEENES